MGQREETLRQAQQQINSILVGFNALDQLTVMVNASGIIISSCSKTLDDAEANCRQLGKEVFKSIEDNWEMVEQLRAEGQA